MARRSHSDGPRKTPDNLNLNFTSSSTDATARFREENWSFQTIRVYLLANGASSSAQTSEDCKGSIPKEPLFLFDKLPNYHLHEIYNLLLIVILAFKKAIIVIFIIRTIWILDIGNDGWKVGELLSLIVPVRMLPMYHTFFPLLSSP